MVGIGDQLAGIVHGDIVLTGRDIVAIGHLGGVGLGRDSLVGHSRT